MSNNELQILNKIETCAQEIHFHHESVTTKQWAKIKRICEQLLKVQQAVIFVPPKTPKKKPKKCPKCKKKDVELFYGPDPFDQDRNGNNKPVWQCRDCHNDSAGEI